MKVAVSFLKSNYEFKKTIDLIDKSTADFIHVDISDGLFVNSKTPFSQEHLDILKQTKKKKDVHLMTLHLKNYIDVLTDIKPYMITFHYEATTKPLEVINYLKKKKIKVGLAINPFTLIEEIEPYLSNIDLVLLLGVIPGYGGQKFIPEVYEKFKQLAKLRRSKKYKFKISVDGGINAEVIQNFSSALDICVAGSYICNANNFDVQIKKLKNPSL